MLLQSGIELSAILCGFSSPSPVDQVVAGLELGAKAVGLLPTRQQKLAKLVQQSAASMQSSGTTEFEALGDADREAIVELLKAQLQSHPRKVLLNAAFLGEAEFFGAIVNDAASLTASHLSDDEQGYYRALVGAVHALVEALALSSAELAPVVMDAIRQQHLNQLTARDVRSIVIDEFERNTRTAPHLVLGSRPRLVKNFVERAELTSLRAAVFAREGNTLQVLSGMRGSGKSQIAAAIAAECEADSWPCVVWVSASDAESARAQLKAAAVNAGLARPDDEVSAAVTALCAWLATGNGVDRLFVFDNVERIGDVVDLLPRARGLRVVITTTSSSPELFDTIAVGELPPGEATALLLSASGREHAHGASAVAQELGYLPLALAQAAATIKQSGYDFDAYLAVLRAQPLTNTLLPDEGAVYSSSVWSALAMSVESALAALADRPDTAAALWRSLTVMSLLSEHGVPRKWLQTSAENEFDAAIAVGSLITSSLLTASANGEDVVLHRLIARVVRERLRESGELATAATAATLTLANAFAAAHPNDQPIPERDAVLRIITQYADIAQQDECALLHENQDFLTLAGFSAAAADRLREPRAALALTPYLGHVASVLGPQSDAYRRMAGDIATAQLSLGKFAEGIQLRQHLLEQAVLTEGDISESAVRRTIHLANAHTDKGDRAGAERLLQNALITASQLPDGADELGIVVRASLAMLSASHDGETSNGEASGGVAIDPHTLATLLHDAEHSPAINDAEVLVLRSNLAHAYLKSNKPELALPLFEQVLQVRRESLGPEHPSTLATTSNLMTAYTAAGNTQGATALATAALALVDDTLDADHPVVLTLKHNLAHAQKADGHVFVAAKIYREVVSARERTIGKLHPDTFASRLNLAWAYVALENHVRAETTISELLHDAESAFGANDPLTRRIQQDVETIRWGKQNP